MKIAFGMIIFNGNYVLQEVLESVYEHAHQILIAEGPVQYWQSQGFTTSTDGTSDILHEFYDPDNKIKITHGQYSEKNEQCNAYMKFLKNDTNYIWNLDSDEVFKQNDLQQIISILEEYQPTSVGFKSISFYGGFDHYLTGFEEGAEFHRISRVYPGAKWATHRPPTIANSPFPKRHIGYNELANIGIRMYHYSYVFPDQVRQKVQYYKAAVSKDNCIDDYFEKVYIPWVTQPELRDKIEHQYEGVHEFKPQYRGWCKAEPFTGQHPYVIQRRMKKLKSKFNHQLKEILQ